MALLPAALQGLLLAASLVLCVPVAVLSIQVLSATRASRSSSGRREELSVVGGRAAIAVLMPAHDEAAGVAASVASVLAQLSAGDRLVVVADNCSDDTARVAGEAGAEVVERHDDAKRGKGYALDFGVRALAASPPAAVIVVDADCVAGPGAIDQIARRCIETGRPVQALYLMHAPPGAPLKTRIAEFAWTVKNEVRALGFHRLGLPCQLMGSGMAFPWSVISAAPLASGHIVEDLQLGLDLAASGTPPLFCPEALVTSVFPLTAVGLASQRTRWEHGHMAIIATMGPRLLWQALTRRQGALTAMAFDVCVPPLTTLVMALSVVLLVSALTTWFGAPPISLLVSAVAMAMLAASLAVAWRQFGRKAVSLRELGTVPLYVLGKVPMYVRMLWKRQTEWVRTKRDDGPR